MNVGKRTIYLVKHGSHAYETNISTSDVDFKGICIPTQETFFGFCSSFEQSENVASISGEFPDYFPKDQKSDVVIYSLKKFAKLAAGCNPNIIEILNVADEDVLYLDDFGEALLNIRKEFLSKRVKDTFSGFARGQLHRIKSHRSWLLNPPQKKPERSDFGLKTSISKTKMGAFEMLIKNDLIRDLTDEVIELFSKEQAYQNALRQWNQYQEWLASRNPDRAALEAKFGYDTKHAGHLIRLMRMCCEILETGNVVVKRPDAEELIAIRQGVLKYDELIERSDNLFNACNALYETSSLRDDVDHVMLDRFICDLTETYLRNFG